MVYSSYIVGNGRTSIRARLPEWSKGVDSSPTVRSTRGFKSHSVHFSISFHKDLLLLYNYTLFLRGIGRGMSLLEGYQFFLYLNDGSRRYGYALKNGYCFFLPCEL